MVSYRSASSHVHPQPEESSVTAMSWVSTEQLNMFEELYRKLVQQEEGLTKEELCHDAFGLEKGYFADRMFSLFDKNQSGRVGEAEFTSGLSKLVTKDETEFIDFLFDLIDVDGSGKVDREEVFQGMLASLRANKLSLAFRVKDFLDGDNELQQNSDVSRARVLADEVFRVSATGDGMILRDDFKRVYQSYMSEWGEKAPQLTKTRITTRCFQNYMRRTEQFRRSKCSLKQRPRHRRMLLWMKQHPTRTVWLCTWVLINVALFSWKFLVYTLVRTEAFELFGYCLSFARGSAECLKFNVAIALFSVCRAFLTFLRNIMKGELLRFINIDDEISTHKLCGVTILFFVIIHSAAHVCDFHIVGYSTAIAVNRALGTSFTNETKPSEVELWFASWQGLTGLAMLLCMTVAYPGVLHWMRNRGHFHIFWGTHQALIAMTVVMMIHGIQNLFEPFTSVYWVGIPFAIYMLGRIKRLLICGKSHRTKLCEKPRLLPPNVLEIKFTRKGFPDFKAGQYVFLNVPKISFFEWHPFTLTSAPGDSHLSVHVRSVGGWTRALHQTLLTPAENKPPAALYVDGPYGAPSQAYERYKICVFVAAGIGITPYASILSHVLNQVKKRDSQKKKGTESKSGACMVEKIYLFWTTRDEASVAWFDKILQDLHRLDATELIEVHHFYTSAHEKGDFRNALIGLAHGIQGYSTDAEVEGTLFDLHRSRYFSHFGRPDWDVVFEGIKEACSGIDNYCGIFATVPPRFSSILSRTARSHSTKDFKFHYTAENF